MASRRAGVGTLWRALSMADGAENSVDELASVALLGGPVRLELYRWVAGIMSLLALEEAAHGVAASVKFAAPCHLDRLVEAEMVGFGYRRLSGRTGADRAAGSRSN